MQTFVEAWQGRGTHGAGIAWQRIGKAVQRIASAWRCSAQYGHGMTWKNNVPASQTIDQYRQRVEQ
jgi:hypothetical protein